MTRTVDEIKKQYADLTERGKQFLYETSKGGNSITDTLTLLDENNELNSRLNDLTITLMGIEKIANTWKDDIGAVIPNDITSIKQLIDFAKGI